MTVYQIWDLVGYIAGKFNRSGAIPPDRFNILLPQCQSERYLSLLKEVIAFSNDRSALDKVLSTTPLRVFKESETMTAGNYGEANLPADYYRYISVQTIYASANNSGGNMVRPIDIVAETEFAKRQGSILTRSDVLPFGKVTATQIVVVPYDIEDYTLEYFRTPSTPYMDYCQDTDNPTLMVFMPVGSKVHLDDAQIPCLYDAAGTLLYSKVTKSGTYPITSTTIELEWDPMDHDDFVYRVLSKCGINLGEGDVAKYAIAMTEERA